MWRNVQRLIYRRVRPRVGMQDPPPPRASLGVLFVHGMGTHAPGATLRAFGDPLLDLLSRDAIGAEDVMLDETELGTPNEPAHARCAFTVDGSPRTWLLAESCWSDSFKPVAYPRIAYWLVAAVPWTIGEYLRGAWARERAAARFPWIRWFRKLLIALYGAVLTLLTGPLVILLSLLLVTRLIPSKSLRELVDRIPRALAASLGDVYVILTTKVDRASIRGQVMRDYEWLAARCEHPVVVAHSAGAAVTHMLIAEETMRGVETYVTLGEAIWRMRWMTMLSQRTAPRFWALALAISGTAAIVAVIPVAANGPTYAWAAFLAGGIVLHAVSAFVVWTLAIGSTRETVLGELAGKVTTWRDYVASSDPIPAGALTENAHGSTPAGREHPLGDAYRPVGVHNRRSIFLDHTSYADNIEEFVAGLTRDLAEADGTRGLRITPWSLEAGKEDRTTRTLSLALLRFSSCLASAAALLVLAIRPQALAALSDDRFAGNVARAVVGDPAMAGAAIAIAMLVVAWLPANIRWRAWDRSALQNYPEFGDRRPYITMSFLWALGTTAVVALVFWRGHVQWLSWESAVVGAALVVGFVTQLAVLTVAEVRDLLYAPS
jgi:hypothetical protein